MPVSLVNLLTEELTGIGDMELLFSLESIEVVLIDELDKVQFDPLNTICVGENASLEQIFYSFKKFGIRQFVQQNSTNFIYELVQSGLLLKKMSTFFKDPIPLLLPHFDREKNCTYDTPSSAIEFNSEKDKAKILRSVARYFSERSTLTGLKDKALRIADELTTNALVHTPLQLSNSKGKAQIYLANDGNNLLIGCKDTSGIILENDVIHSLWTSYSDQTNATQMDSERLGLGLRFIADTCRKLVIVSKSNEYTFVGGIMPLGVGHRKIALMPKNVNMLFI